MFPKYTLRALASQLSSHEVGGTETGGQGGGELLGSLDAIESPKLWCWRDGGTSLEFWPELVGVGSFFSLAGLDGESGSVSQVLVGGTAAEFIVTFRSWGSCSVSCDWWVFASCTSRATGGGQGCLGVCCGNLSGSLLVLCLLCIPISPGILGDSIFDTLAVGKSCCLLLCASINLQLGCSDCIFTESEIFVGSCFHCSRTVVLILIRLKLGVGSIESCLCELLLCFRVGSGECSLVFDGF